MLKLILANKNYSSWSMRAWLFLKESGLDFEEKVIGLFTEQWNKEIRNFNPIGKAPALVLGDGTRIWDSLAIIGYLQQTDPKAMQFPDDPKTRALAWSLTAEMHSGFLGIRNQLPMNLKQRVDCPNLDPDTETQIQRIKQIWTDCLDTFGGPWLLGDFSVVDIMYAPVVTRFHTYKIEVTKTQQDYMDRIRQRASVQEWTEAALVETETLYYFDNLLPIEEAPITPG
ncbi:MAG: glutathione S-transferase family protein [Pseudomonadota bacterium]